MSKYFAKYLPVEGDVRSIKFIQYQDKIWGKHNISSNFPDKLFIIPIGGEGIGTSAFISECKGVEMFLCSRDIKVGDKVINPDTLIEEELTQEIWDYFHATQSMWKSQPYFKVVGKISPDALPYVKECQEFDEDQIMGVWYEPYDGDDYIPIKDFADFVRKQNLKRREGYKIKTKDCLYAIKGPCGHFH